MRCDWLIIVHWLGYYEVIQIVRAEWCWASQPHRSPSHWFLFGFRSGQPYRWPRSRKRRCCCQRVSSCFFILYFLHRYYTHYYPLDSLCTFVDTHWDSTKLNWITSLNLSPTFLIHKWVSLLFVHIINHCTVICWNYLC